MNNRGVVLIGVYLVVAVLLILGTALFLRVVHESFVSERDRHAAEAFYIAEGAYRQALFDLQKDFADSFDWFDGNINGMAMTPNTFSWITVPYTSDTLGDGTFLVELQGVVGNPGALKIRATGTSSGITRRLLINADIVDLNLWNNVIFGAVGQGGNVINGNVDVRGSVHILGDTLSPGDLAMDLSGSGNIGNNYDGIPAALGSRLPSLPVVDFNGELIQSLGSEVRIRRGQLGLSGTGIAGSPNITGNALKETLNGVYITNGYGGNQGANNVSSDNGTGNGYDAGNVAVFKTFSDPYKYNGVTYPTYSNFVRTQGMDIAATLAAAGVPWTDNIDSTVSSFGPYSDGNGNSIRWIQSSGTLIVSGIVYNEDTLDLGKKNTTVLYEGKGTMVALGDSSDIEVHGDLLSHPSGVFPTNHALAFLARDSIEIATGGGESQVNVTGVFYGQNSIQMDKQSQLAGTFVSNYFGMDQTPSIYQVPSFDARNHPGLIGRDPLFFMRVGSWQEIQ